MSSPPEPSLAAPDRSRSRFRLRPLLIGSQLLLLTLFVLGFGTTTYLLVRRGVYEQAESDLLGAARLTMERLQNGTPQSEIEIDAVYAEKFGLAPRDHAYLFLVDQRGAERLRGDFPPDWIPPGPTKPDRRPFHSRSEGHFLEVWLNDAAGRIVLVGRPLAKEFDRLNRVLYSVVASGAACFLVGLGLSFAISGWIATPIVRLTRDAEAITPDALGQRLENESQVAEIARLGTVLNSMLGRLDSAFRRQTQFTADASHELRTPVTVILSQAEHALAKPRSDAEYRFALETCLNAGRSMRRLIENLLTLARSDAAPPHATLAPTRLDLVVKDACELLRPLADERGIRIELTTQEAIVAGDAAQLAQVASNLITNAIVYNRPNGTVRITVEAEQGTGVLKVIDSGIGISQADQSRLFERFFRADAARRLDAGQGAGLGLAIVQAIVTAHRGTISVQSTPNVGTEVTVRIPRSS